MHKEYKANKLADILDNIALGNTYSFEALIAAKRHSVTTYNDRLMLNRWTFGGWTAEDGRDLMQLAIYIRESNEPVSIRIK